MPCHYMYSESVCVRVYTQCVRSNNGTNSRSLCVVAQLFYSQRGLSCLRRWKCYMAFSRDLTKSGISVSLIVAVVVMSIKCRFAINFFFRVVIVVHPLQFPIPFLSRFLYVIHRTNSQRLSSGEYNSIY